MKDYGCSNIDELVDEVKELRIKCKNIRYMDGKKLENALIKAEMHGWEQGKKQVGTPYDFTLADNTYIENIWKDLMKLAIPEDKKIKELQDEIERLKKIVFEQPKPYFEDASKYYED